MCTVPPASVSTGRPNWRRWRGTMPNWRRLCWSQRLTSNSGNSSWRPIRKRQRGYTSGYDSAQDRVPVWSGLDSDVCSLFSAGDRAGVRERPNDGHQIPENRTQQNYRGAGVGSEGQGGGNEERSPERKKQKLKTNWLKHFLSFSLQELERLKAEVEGANEFKFQKDSLTQKLKVSKALICWQGADKT